MKAKYQTNPSHMRKALIIKVLRLNLVCCLIVFSACGPNCPEDPDCQDSFILFTNEDEKNLGTAIHQAMISSYNFNIMTDAMDSNNYIKSVRIQLVATSLMEKLDDFDWNIYIILNDNQLDCFTTVGGNIYIYSGLLNNIQNESQFMSILAHEMFYVDRSYHMDVLNANYSFPFLLDASRGGDDAMVIEMLNLLYNVPRNPNIVEEADRYGEAIICETERPVDEFKVIIEGMEQANTLWYKNHKESSSSSFSSRTNSLAMTGGTCGGDTENRAAFYSAFVNSLP